MIQSLKEDVGSEEFADSVTAKDKHKLPIVGSS